MATTRARKAKFLASFDSLPGSTVQAAVASCLRRYGINWLTDEQLAEITSDVAGDARFSHGFKIRNRRLLRRVA